jgi:hypothetical protein
MKLRNIIIERLIIIIVTILALIGWTRPFHPTAKNLNNKADKIV